MTRDELCSHNKVGLTGKPTSFFGTFQTLFRFDYITNGKPRVCQLLHFSYICHSTKPIRPHSTERGLPKKPESHKINFTSPKVFEESRRGGCETEEHTGGKRAAQRFGFCCKFSGLLMSPLFEAEHCQQLHLMGKGTNEFLITET